MCSANNTRSAWRWACALACALAVGLLAGCIADTAEDSNLPWSSNKGWEGMGPVPASFTDRYD
ncbi:MAG: hypothetical protein IJ146_04840 [Kiritimatiellae bacterium]|nr:hypothetical protein [Kiritimatiellia bacterium]